MTTVNYLRKMYRTSPVKPKLLRDMYFKLRRIKNQDRIVTKKIEGIRYELHLNEFIDSNIYYYGCFEEETTSAIRKLLKPGQVVLDIGANIGSHTLPMAKIVGEDGKVIAFEPMNWAVKKLRRNIELNELSNIEVEVMALSDVCQKELAGFRTSWVKANPSQANRIPAEMTDFMSLDEYVRIRSLNQVDFIKLDVDGFEFKVIKGGKKTLQNMRPVLSLELGNWTLEKHGSSTLQLAELLSGMGYDFFRESDFSRFEGFESIQKEFPNPETSTINVIACHSHAIEKLSSSDLQGNVDENTL